MGGGLYPRLEIAIVLALAAVVIAAAAMLAGLFVLHLTLPRSDAAHGSHWLDFADVAAVFAAVVAAFEYPLMLWLLRRTRLSVSLPVVGIVAVASTAAGVACVGPPGLLFGLLASPLAMIVCRQRFASEQVDPLVR